MHAGFSISLVIGNRASILARPHWELQEENLDRNSSKALEKCKAVFSLNRPSGEQSLHK